MKTIFTHNNIIQKEIRFLVIDFCTLKYGKLTEFTIIHQLLTQLFWMIIYADDAFVCNQEILMEPRDIAKFECHLLLIVTIGYFFIDWSSLREHKWYNSMVNIFLNRGYRLGTCHIDQQLHTTCWLTFELTFQFKTSVLTRHI